MTWRYLSWNQLVQICGTSCSFFVSSFFVFFSSKPWCSHSLSGFLCLLEGIFVIWSSVPPQPHVPFKCSLASNCLIRKKMYVADLLNYNIKIKDTFSSWSCARGTNLILKINILILSNIYKIISLIAGEYSCLTVDLTFKREFSYYLLTIYVPCCMLVIVSWVSFWLDPNAVPARVSLGVTTLLTMSTQTASINNSLPPVAYTKAIDVWTGVSTHNWWNHLALDVSGQIELSGCFANS